MFTIHFTVACRAGNMAHNLRNEELAGIHTIYGAAHVNSKEVVGLYQERFPKRYLPVHEQFTAIHRRLREHGRFRVDRRAYG